MNDLRQELHQLVDSLPDEPAMEHAKIALLYCANPEKHRMNIQKAKEYLVKRSQQQLREHAERIGRNFITGIGSGAGITYADGSHHSSMVGFEDGKEATVHLYVYRGIQFEITETFEFSGDGRRLIRRERIVANDGTEQMLMAELPVPRQ